MLIMSYFQHILETHFNSISYFSVFSITGIKTVYTFYLSLEDSFGQLYQSYSVIKPFHVCYSYSTIILEKSYSIFQMVHIHVFS